MTFQELLAFLFQQAETQTFRDAAANIQKRISGMTDAVFLNILEEIGVIPEKLPHDSTVEKLFAKTADIILCECFRRLGLQASVLQERADSADVFGSSPIYGYSFAADAKTFRLSRTAKNQKDFKVSALSQWRGNADFAILVCPYFQYPRKESQIYKQALDSNVCLLSWEHLHFLLQNQLQENSRLDLTRIWNSSSEISRQTLHADTKKRQNFLNADREIFCSTAGLQWEDWKQALSQFQIGLKLRSGQEVKFWEKRITEIQNYSREKAVEELLSTLKIELKIAVIEDFIRRLPELDTENEYS